MRARFASQGRRDFTTQRVVTPAKPKVDAPPVKAATEYCPRCLAVLERRAKDQEARCPSCQEHRKNVRRFCRKCLQVHGELACTPWRPA